uniref:protein PRR14L isoform X2 n=1 Tax=Jaculus jaculus TaxID=51337 RepID=UPI001E1B59E8|nr:protein PRR14L isoform X2 [Jaculus jaculus]
MLSSGIETQPVPLDSSMSAAVQEIYSELPISVSKELHVDPEPSVIPDVKPGLARSLTSERRALPLELQRTHAETCSEETSETLDHGDKTGQHGLVDPTARESVSSGILDGEKRTKSMELKVFRDQKDQAEVIRDLCERAKEEPCQHALATRAKISPKQENLLMQSSKEILCTDLPEDFLRNREGNVQITTETLPKSPGDGQGCSEYPEADKIMTSGAVSEAKTLVSIEPLICADPQFIEAPGRGAVSRMGRGKEELCSLSQICRADDRHQQVLGHHKEKSRCAHDSAMAMGNGDARKPLEEVSYFTPYLSGPESRTKPFEKCDLEGSGLTKECAEQPCQEDQSRSSACERQREDQLGDRSSRGELLVCSVRQQEKDGASGGSDEKETADFPKEQVPSNCCLQHKGSSSSFTDATEIMFKKGDLKITLDVEDNLTNSEDHRKTVTFVSHPGTHSQKSSFEEPAQPAMMLNEKICGKDCTSLVGCQRNLQSDTQPNESSCNDFLSERRHHVNLMSEDQINSVPNESSKPQKDPVQLPLSPNVADRLTPEAVQTSQDSVSPSDEQIIACEMRERSCTSELVIYKVEDECGLNQQVSLNSQDHVTLSTDSLLSIKREMPLATKKDALQGHPPPIENGADVITGTQTILTRTKMEDICLQGDKMCDTSSHVNSKPGSPKGRKEMADSGTEGLLPRFLLNAKEAASLPQEVFVAECQNVQSQDLSSCLCVRRNAPGENVCSAPSVFEHSKVILNVNNFKTLKCENAIQCHDPHCQGSEDSVGSGSQRVSNMLEEREPARREVESSVLQGNVRSEMAVCVSESTALNTSTHASSGTERSGEQPGTKEQCPHKETVFCKCSIPVCATQGLNQSTDIPRPETLPDQSPPIFSHFETMNQGVQTLDQKADDVPVCQTNQKRPDKHRSEIKGRPTTKTLVGNHRESLKEPNRERSHSGKNRIVNSGSRNVLSHGGSKKGDGKGAFENIPGSKKLMNLLGTTCADYREKPARSVPDMKVSSTLGCCTRQDGPAFQETSSSASSQRGLNTTFLGTTDQDAGLPSAAAPTVEPLKVKESRAEKVCRFPKDCAAEGCPNSTLAHEVDSVTNHEPDKRVLDRSVSVSCIHHEDQARGGSLRGTRMTERSRLEVNSECGNKTAFGISSKELVSPRCQEDSLAPPQNLEPMEGRHSCLSAQENSATDTHGEELDLKNIFKPKDDELPCENIKGDTPLAEVKEVLPRATCSLTERASVHMSVEKNFCKAAPPLENSTDNQLPLTMETATKVSREEHGGHQRGSPHHLTVEELEEAATREGRVDNSPAISRTHLQCRRVRGAAAAVDQACSQAGEPARVKGPPRNALPGERQIKSQPVAAEDESIEMKESTLAKPEKGTVAEQRPRLKDPKEEPFCHPLRDPELSTGLHLPDASWKEPAPCPAECDEAPGVFGSASSRKRALPLKKQPHRTCKRVPCQEPGRVGRKRSNSRGSAFGNSSANPIPTKAYRLLSPGAAPAPLEPEAASVRSLLSHIPKQRATLCRSLRSLSCRKPTKESALLTRLSILASKLVPAPKPQKLRCRRYSSALVPAAKSYKHLRYKRLLDGLSCNAAQLGPYVAAGGWDRRPNSKLVVPYSPKAVRMGLIDLSNKLPSLLLGSDAFPFSFHVKPASSCVTVTESSRTFPEHCAPARLALGEAFQCQARPPRWAFSLFLSHGCSGMATFREEPGLRSQAHTQAPPQTAAPLLDYGDAAIVQPRAERSVLGLHTLLALCSPGCYRIWTKKRSFSNHMPTMQRLFLTQFTQGLKGLRSPASIADRVFCSLPYSVGRVLSVWSQHGPSSCAFELPALHSTYNRQQSLGTTCSHTMLPNVPLPGVEVPCNASSGQARLEPPVPALVPASCLVKDPAVSKRLLSASEFPVPGFDELDGVTAARPRPQSSPPEQKEVEPEKRPKKVSQIRIRKTIPKPDPNLTPMGLPRPKRLKKKEFSLEEIYTNKNYKSPPANRCLETIFEEPKERNGTLISVSQQKRKRVLEFQDFTVPRKRRARGKVKLAGSFTRAQKAALQGQELDALLIQKLMELETFFAKEEEEQEQSAGC